MNPRGVFNFLLGLVLVGVLVGLGVGVYQAGITQGVIDAGRYPAAATVPVAGYGWHGPGIFGILFGLFFLFLLFGLIRAAIWRGRGWGGGYGPRWHHGHGWGSGWGGGHDMGDGTRGDAGPDAWRAERERYLAEVHRRLHEAEQGGSASPPPAG